MQVRRHAGKLLDKMAAMGFVAEKRHNERRYSRYFGHSGIQYTTFFIAPPSMCDQPATRSVNGNNLVLRSTSPARLMSVRPAIRFKKTSRTSGDSAVANSVPRSVVTATMVDTKYATVAHRNPINLKRYSAHMAA